ncbi:hypothetical protein N7447_001704 [Penicillium robsamsonii]|uniref:uncharacterized protein n=1 Tax=Penicillium robsamsonii TaxID=1792511 RepID=UPI0025469D58|nr:uncharacterized protein N7447_001704 [Penicillium robsamsonii]KAJ5835678.1 hypothetical protein N7447_001704 [Penicillium robsamsonii]
MDRLEQDSSWAEVKTRRPHRKSRYGCKKCKTRRIKCDELEPKCSRCSKMNLICQYPSRSSILAPEAKLEQTEHLLQNEISHIDYGMDSSESSRDSSAAVGSLGSSPVPSVQSPLNLPRDDKHPSSLLQSQTSQMFTPTEFALFNHYLEHTSRDKTVDDEDQYTLQIGIPNLAFQNKFLMKSVLAFSAVCRCCDIINQSSISHGDRGQVVALLSVADQYHMESLREIQATLSGTDQYDHILANAAMMGMYGSSSHRIRIWLVETACSDDIERNRFMPKSRQWISLFRAVRVAYTGIINDRFQAEDVAQPTLATPPIEPVAGCDFQIHCECEVSSQIDQHKGPQDHALYSIMAATVASALERLGRTAREIIKNEMGGCGDQVSPAIHIDSDVQACFAALELFRNITSETFRDNNLMSNTPGHSHLASELDVNPVGQVSKVSPWMQRYTARITSIIPSRLPRRLIMAFVHKAPTKYLNLVEDMMSLMQRGAPGAYGRTVFPLSSMNSEPSLAHQLAVDIFSHWLVLVMLLDKVWWIGGIGAWELGQLITLRRETGWRMSLWKTGEDWWPESMFEISRQFNKHRVKGRV